MLEPIKHLFYLTMDNDSGYSSNNADSNQNSLLENSCEQPQHIFISEDALLEKPEVREASMIMETSGEEEPEEYSHLFYTNDYNEDVKSETSDLSSIITPIKSIETTMSRLNSMLKACSSKKKTISTPKSSAKFHAEYFDVKEASTSQYTEASNSNNFIGISSNNFTGIIESDSQKTVISESSNSFTGLIENESQKKIVNCPFSASGSDGFVNSERTVACEKTIAASCQTTNLMTCQKTIVSCQKVTDSTADGCQESDRELVSEICTNLLNNSMLEGPLLGDQIAQPDEVQTSHATPDKYGKRKRDEAMSPDLFSDEESVQEADLNYTSVLLTQTKAQDERYINRNDKRLLRRVREGVSGRLPPPGLNISITEMLEKYSKNQEYFVSQADVEMRSELNQSHNTSANSESHQDTTSGSFCIDSRKKTLLVTTDLETCLSLKWPKVLEERYHGLHYNRGKVSEEFELLCAKYGQRFVGQESYSSCTIFSARDTPSKKKAANKMRWAAKSPGRRLSHLAKRRITFSSASLQASSSVMSAHARQILVDSRKMQMLNRKKSPRKTPRKTPKKSPRKRMRTPSSSVKKQMAKSLDLFTEEDQVIVKPSTSANRVHATKRALFQSPENKAGPSSKLILPSTSGNASVSPFIKKNTPKRALFLSPKKSPKRTPPKRKLFETKRKRCEFGDELHPAKIPKKLSVVPNDENQPAAPKAASSSSVSSHYIGELSAHHKKKLQWAVFEALKSQHITSANPNFRKFAPTLARVTRRFLPNLSANAPRPEGGTSERMLRIARQHVYAVIKGKTVDEIVQEANKNRLKMHKPTGYISIEQENAMKNKEKELSLSKNRDTVLQDKANVLNSMDKNKSTTTNKLPRYENRVDRVRKVINFDDGRSD